MIGLLLKRWRETEHKTIRQMASIIGVDPSVLARFERGRGVSDKNWIKIFLWLLQNDTIRPK